MRKDVFDCLRVARWWFGLVPRCCKKDNDLDLLIYPGIGVVH